MRHAGLGTLVAATFLLGTAVASAGEVLIPKNAPPYPQTAVVFRAFNGEVNDLTVTRGTAPAFAPVFFDSISALTAGRQCSALPAGGVSCDPADVRAVEAHLKDGDDTAHVVAALSARVWAGSGNDKVVADSFGAQTFVYGEGGDDEVTSGGEGGQVADGGPGDDIVNAGGFAGQGTGLGGSGDDIVYFRTWLYGPAVLDGGKGHDTIVSQPAGGTASGGDGDDIIVIHGRVPERIVPNQDGFAISGGPGADTIIGDVLADTIDGGDGRDYVDVLDGGADTVSCGSGTDVVRYDATDTVAADCEIRLGPTP